MFRPRPYRVYRVPYHPMSGKQTCWCEPVVSGSSVPFLVRNSQGLHLVSILRFLEIPCLELKKSGSGYSLRSRGESTSVIYKGVKGRRTA